MKAATTFGTAASQMIRRTGSEADRKWIESWQRWIVRRLSALAFGGITAAGTYLYVDGQDTIAASGRTRLLLTTRQEERELGDAVSEQLLAQVAQGVCFVADVPGGTARGAEAAAPQIRRLRRQKGRELAKAAQMLLDVSTKIVAAAAEASDVPDGAATLPWRVHLVDTPMKNAVVLPNGHIYVFTGILEDCPSEDVFGFLLGHECAHAVLRHAGEDLSKPFLELIGLSVVAALATLVPDTTAFSTYVTMWLGAGIANTTVDALLEKPYSREHESEADHVGLLFASRACFDPYHAQYLFHQLAKDRKAGKMPEEGTVFNTHPLDRDRQKAVRSQTTRRWTSTTSGALPSTGGGARSLTAPAPLRLRLVAYTREVLVANLKKSFHGAWSPARCAAFYVSLLAASVGTRPPDVRNFGAPTMQ